MDLKIIGNFKLYLTNYELLSFAIFYESFGDAFRNKFQLISRDQITLIKVVDLLAFRHID
jgi:hypothetical protein